ncbi:acyl-CoA dehydrogenase family protein [Mycobacterium sp. 1274761.0]|uniref:acyl-CoA dehydrogenase family protein n=1 Tax=Mycobacterium sp. 1274761.0 TaxID=1834077 RepID=UPI0007FC3597|nr:acyl-CoA dehydrogenase family protein [Mycobacterium sp. 1274761.0]OBK78470.1 acyl-CoA dehydrogenase [Mycobacterium sp. 1274761.0]
MRVIPSQDERDLAAMCRSVLAAELEPGAQWKALADAGVLSLAVDGTLSDIGVFCVEAGRALCPRVVQSTLYASLALSWFGVGSQWLPRLASGEARGTVAVFDPRDAAAHRPVSGVAEFVVDADVADVIVVATDGGVVAVDMSAVTVEPITAMGGFPAYTVSFDERVLAEPAPVNGDQLRRLANAVVALDCLDLVGVGEAVIDRTVDYTQMREQFGRPIASFQAAQHIVADMHIALTAARLAAQSAVFQIGRGQVATRETAIARIRAAEVKKITLDAHQLHGGMGYVVDTGLHRFSERARILSTLGGGADIAATWLEGVR